MREGVKTMTSNEALEVKITEIEDINFPVDSIRTNIKNEINKKIQKNKQSASGSSNRNSGNSGGSASSSTRTDIGSGKTASSPNVKPPVTSIETKFWHLVHKDGVPQKRPFDDLFKNNDIDWKDDYKFFYNKYLSRSGENYFDKFKNIPELDRKKTTTLPELQKLIENN